MVRLLALIGHPDAALALICDNVDVRRTSPQLCQRANYVSDKPADHISTQPTVMPPAPVRPTPITVPAPIAEGSIGYGTDNKRYVFTGGVWRPDQTAAQAVGAIQSQGVVK
jgi:hypothetical protein